MGPSDIIQIICLIILVLLSAFFSSAETALTTVNKIRMRSLSESGDNRAKRVLRITDDSGKMLSAILIGNNIVNLSASSLATSFAIKFLGSVGAGVATGILTLLILIFGEVTPKTKATLHADDMSLRYSIVIEVLMKVLTPLIFIVNKLSVLVLYLLRVDVNEKNDALTEEDLRTIVDVGQENGVIEDEERDMIHNLFDFSDAKAKEMMIPRIDMTFVKSDASYDEIIDIYREDKFTRLPVYDDSTDKVVGTINVKDLLLVEDTENFSITQILREPYFTFEHKNTADLFMEMRKDSQPMAIVLDEYGDTAGLITLEDLLEEIVGDIRDEYDTDEVDEITQLNDSEYMIMGTANLDDVSQVLDLALSSEDYDTISGYCLDLLDHMPSDNEKIVDDNGVTFTIAQMDKNRIEKIHVKLPDLLEND